MVFFFNCSRFFCNIPIWFDSASHSANWRSWLIFSRWSAILVVVVAKKIINCPTTMDCIHDAQYEYIYLFHENNFIVAFGTLVNFHVFVAIWFLLELTLAVNTWENCWRLMFIVTEAINVILAVGVATLHSSLHLRNFFPLCSSMFCSIVFLLFTRCKNQNWCRQK